VHGSALALAGGAIACGYIQCVGETKAWPKGPTGSCGGPESLHLTGAKELYHLVIAISAKNFPKLEVARQIGLAKMKS
jgi:hypothetical protein